MKTDLERLMECLTCSNDPSDCGCLEEDEDGSCIKWSPLDFLIDTEEMRKWVEE